MIALSNFVLFKYEAHYDPSLTEPAVESPLIQTQGNDEMSGAMSHWLTGVTEEQPSKDPLPNWIMESMWSGAVQQGDQVPQGYPINQFTPIIGNVKYCDY